MLRYDRYCAASICTHLSELASKFEGGFPTEAKKHGRCVTDAFLLLLDGSQIHGNILHLTVVQGQFHPVYLFLAISG